MVLLPLLLVAQQRKDGRLLVALPISEATKQTGNNYELRVVKPTCVVLQPNQTFVIQNTWHAEGTSVAKTGVGTVTRFTNDLAVLKGIADSSKQIQKGDMVLFLVPLVKPEKDTLFFKMARLGIHFTTVEDSTFYDRNKMLSAAETYRTENILNIMATDVQYTGNAMLQQKDAQDQPVTVGKYKGQQLFAVMQKVTAADLFLFLKYVYDHPNKYMAQTWKISETFATWVVSGTPL